MADGAAKPRPEKKLGADVEEVKGVTSFSSIIATSKVDYVISFSPPGEDGEDPPLLDRSDDARIQVSSGGREYWKARTFEDLDLCPELLEGLYGEMGFRRPSPIQAIALPMVLTPPYKDLVAQARNGSGKTACFLLGMLSRVEPNRKVPQAICICPTRELARQNTSELMKMGKFTIINCALAIPKAIPVSKMVPITDQVVIGTSGTVAKLIKHHVLATDGIKVLVIAEADLTFSVDGFLNDCENILKGIRKESGGGGRDCQVLIFTTTLNKDLDDFSARFSKDANKVCLMGPCFEKVKLYKVQLPCEMAKIEVIRDRILGLGQFVGQVIIFVQSGKSTKDLQLLLQAEDYICSSLEGSVDSSYKEKILQEFRDGYTKVLITSDVNARGFDQAQVNLVINYDMPVLYGTVGEPDYMMYWHRIGKVERVGRKGAVFNLLCGGTDDTVMTKMANHFQLNVHEVPSWENVDDFETALKDAGLLN